MMLRSFLEEARLFAHKKMNWIVLFILPLVVTVMMGFELEDEVISDIPLAVIDLDQSAFSRQMIDAFDSNLTFDLVAYPASEAELEQMIRNSEARVGMIIPHNFYKDVAALESPSVLMIYDGSHMSMTSAAKSKAVEILLTYKTGAAIKQISGRLGISEDEALSIANVFNFENRFLYNPAKSFEDFLAPVLMAGYVQAALSLMASVAVNHSIYQMDNRKRFGYSAGKIAFYTLAATVSFMLCAAVQVGVFGIPFVGSFGILFLMTLGLCFAVSAFCVLVSALFRNQMVALIAGAVLFIPNSVMAGTTWPLNAMPIGYQGFAQWTPFARFAVNFRDVYLKGTGVEQFGNDIAYLFIFGLVVSVITEVTVTIAAKEGKEVSDDLSGDIQNPIQVHL